jgi:capsular polysaccharide biosynthesis protein
MRPARSTTSPGESTPGSAEKTRPQNGAPDRLLLALLDETKDLLAAVGVRLSVVSIDEDRAVLIGEPVNDQVSVQTACDLSRRALARVAAAAPRSQTSLVELRCGRRSEWPCTFSLEWTQHRPASSAPPEIPSLEMLIAGQGHGFPTGLETRTEPPATETTSPRHWVGGGGVATDVVGAPPEKPKRIPARPPDWRRFLRWIGRRWRSLRPLLSWRPRHLPPWLSRRWWLLILCVLAGTAGGYLARSSQTPMYTASSEIVVATGAGLKGPGDANDAIALALTDASILPSDQALLQTVSRKLGTSASSVAKHLSAAVETGTSVINVSYRDTRPAAAIRGANAVGRAVTSSDEESSAIPNGSLALVQLADSASTSGMLLTYGLPLGALLGLLIGLVFVVALERADPRADDVEDLAEATGTAVSAYPGPVSLAELERLIGRASAGAPSATLVPLSAMELAHAVALRDGLEAAPEHPRLAFDVAGPVGSMDAPLTRGTGPTVLVVKSNARLRAVRESVQHLELLGRRPVWAVLAVGEGATVRLP